MKTLIITKEMLDADNFYVGATPVENCEGHIEITANLGTVKFKGSIRATGRIVAHERSGIEAGSGIKAGWGIKAGGGIKAGWGIEAGGGIESNWIDCNLRIFAGSINHRLPTREETLIKAEIRNGTVAVGEVVKPD